MKRAVFAFFLLLTLFAAAVCNTAYLERFTGSLEEKTSASLEAVRSGDGEKALGLAREAYDDWLAADGYTHITVRHSEIDSLTDSFCDLIGDLEAGDDGAAEGSCAKVLAHLDSIARMEQLRLGSIF